MERNNQTAAQWLDTATQGVRFGPDRAAVRAELTAHLEDKAADLRRIFPDMSDAEALERTLGEMGDAAEVGRALAHIHTPWLGWLWMASRWAMGLALTLALVLWGWRGFSALDTWQTLEEANEGKVPYGEQIEEYYLAGDPATPFPRLEGEVAVETDIVRTPVRWAEETQAVRAGLYALSVTRGALWQFQGGSLDGVELESPRYSLECELRATGLPGLPLHPEAACHISGADSLGNAYANTRTGHGAGVPYILATELSGKGWEQRFRLSVSHVPPEAEWFQLDYDWGGVEWTLTVPLKEERP